MTMRKNDKFANQLFSFVMRKTYYLTVNFLCLLSTVDGKLKSILTQDSHPFSVTEVVAKTILSAHIVLVCSNL